MCEPQEVNCIVCDTPSLEELTAYRELSRITSDCRSYKAGGKLFHCLNCGAVQKMNDREWRADCYAIYSEYDVYSVSQGQEQSVRSGLVDGTYGKRSDLVLNEVANLLQLPQQGAFLDFGCGSGVSSMAVSKRFQNWVIDGFDLDQRMEAELSEISGFSQLYVGSPESIPSRYDLIMLTHVLEHVPTPIETMKVLAGLLKPSGAIVIQVPNRVENPYDLLVADHLIHFDTKSLSGICEKAGLGIAAIATDWVMKELSLVAVRKEAACETGETGETGKGAFAVDPSTQLSKLLRTAKSLGSIQADLKVGFFGTSLVAIWMSQELCRKPSFYVDEDPAKIGRMLNGVKILAPTEVPEDAVVIPAMADELAQIVAQRYLAKGLNMISPGDL